MNSGSYYTKGNKDDITEAIHGLDIFTKNWCMNCEETKAQNEPIFRCSKCLFREHETGLCSVKKFANYYTHDYPMRGFGCMGQL